MELQTRVDIPESCWKIEPEDRILCVGSCFADNIGALFKEDNLQAEVNPLGVMYNPVSVVRSLSSLSPNPYNRLFTPFGSPVSRGTETLREGSGYHREAVIITLGTNHVYREKATGEIVNNCRKRPQNLFSEEIMSVEECYSVLKDAISSRFQVPGSRFIITVSPIRYRKYGYHESQLSKATLMLAADLLTKELPEQVAYFPAYELMNDELRDYRFYKSDMLHPSEQAVEYIYERFKEVFFSKRTMDYLKDWKPIKEALGHRPLNPESEEYRDFRKNTEEKLKAFNEKWKATL